MDETPTLRGVVPRLLARIFVRDWRHPERSDVALRLALTVTVFSVVVNVFLFGLKLGFGLYISSLALIADALDTLGDILLDGVGLVALRVALRGPDPEHPYGHERAEEIASLTVATVLFLIGLQFGHAAARRLVEGSYGGPFSTAAVVVALVSVVGKSLVSGAASGMGRYTRSRLLDATAWHNATDMLSGLLAAAAIAGRRFGYNSLDPLFALVIAGLIVVVGVHIFRASAKALLGRGGSPEDLERIRSVACAQSGVLGCGDIEVHWYGRKRRVSLRIRVADTLTVGESHAIADRVERALHGIHADWEPVVHVDPVGLGSRPIPRSPR